MKRMKKVISLCLVVLSLVSTVHAINFESKDSLKLGGAFRYTYMKNSWEPSHQDKGGQVVFDVLIFSASGRIKGIEFFIEPRYYAESFGGFMLHNGYVGLPLTDHLKLKLGMPRTPFGILPYTSNSFMFNMPYYLGFEDDADFGALLEYTPNERWEMQLSLAKNAEDVFSQKNNRYAYDISGVNEELNQLTGRIVYHFGRHEIGYTGQYGRIYNTQTRGIGSRYAQALHGVFRIQRWNIKAQTLYYDFSPKNETPTDYITLGAFGADYKVARRGVSSCLSIAYKLPVNHRLLNDIKFYNDWSSLHKTIGHVDPSYMNVLGCMLHTGPIYMLVDYVLAKNHPWIGKHYADALYNGTTSRWERRVNINIGIYF